jgi:hypothetical protein
MVDPRIDTRAVDYSPGHRYTSRQRNRVFKFPIHTCIIGPTPPIGRPGSDAGDNAGTGRPLRLWCCPLGIGSNACSTIVGTNGDGRDGGDPVVTIAMAQNQSLAQRAPGLVRDRTQEEARFFDEHDMGRQPCGVLFFCRPDTPLPLRNRCFAAFDRARFRFLVAPFRLVQELADNIAMILHTESS